MRIEKLQLFNFRCFKSTSIQFDKRLTVILADNGFGKTALLDAVAIGMSRVLGRLPHVSGVNLKDSDLRILSDEKTYPFAALDFEAKTENGTCLRWSMMRRRDNSVKAGFIVNELIRSEHPIVPRGIKEVTAYADNLILEENEDKSPIIPIFSYYGTNRSLRSAVQRRRGFRKKFSRFEALQGAFESTTQFKQAFEWFNAMEDQERREKLESGDLKRTLPVLEAVRLAVSRVLPEGYQNLRTESRPLRFVIDYKESGTKIKTFRVTQLSDGYRTVLALVMDYARRLAQAYPHGNAKLGADNILAGQGIALIDEVDLHLHPNWQQTIVPSLLKTFPGTQFIITTHSPQVITTVPPESLRKLELADGQIEIRGHFEFSKGAEAQYALEDIQGVSARAQALPIVQKLERYLQLVYEDKWDSEEALGLREQLNEWGHGFEPALVKADIDIRVREFRRKKS